MTSEEKDHIKIAERSFDKSITAIRIAMNSLREIINGLKEAQNMIGLFMRF